MPVASTRTPVAKKASAKPEPKRSGTAVRCSDEFAEAIRKVCSIENVSAADFIDKHFLPSVQEHYRGLLAREADLMGARRKA